MKRRWLGSRSLQREIMDDHKPEQAVVDRVYTFLSMVNRRFGGTAATISRFEHFSRAWSPGQRIEIVDIGSGAADLPRALVAWGRRRGFDVRVTAVDISRRALDYARRSAPPDERLRLVCADVSRPFCADGSFDYATSALFFHHLTDEAVIDVLRWCGRQARRGIVVNDLERSPRAWICTWLLTWPCHPILHHDGPLSVRRAFTADELTILALEAGVEWLTIKRHFGERMTLAGERPPETAAHHGTRQRPAGVRAR